MKKRYWIAILCAVLALMLTVAAASADTGDVYGKMTDVNGLHDGDRIILVSDNGSNYQAMATDFSGIQVTITDTMITEQNGMLVLTLTETTGGWLLAANDGYLAVDGSALTFVTDSANAAVWTISIASDGTATISCADGSIVFAEQDGAYRFFCGEGGNEIAIYNSTFETEQHPFGHGLWWSYANGKLTIGGRGFMPDFNSNSQPWNQLVNSITEIEVQNGVKSIGNYAFYNCTGLSEITIPDCVTSVAGNAFSGTGWWNSQSNGIVYLDYILLGVKGTCGQIVRIKDGTRVLANNAFYYNSQITRVTIPDSVKSIGVYAFRGCTGLQSITIGNGVETIDYCAFYGCMGLTEITIPDSVTSIGDSAFSGCTGLQSVTIGDGVTTIGGNAFSGCTGLTEITIPDSVTSIGNSAFYGCTGIQSVTIGNGVTSIGNLAFYGCMGLTDVYYHGTKRTRNGITIGSSNDFLKGAKWHYLTSNAIEWKTLPDKLQFQEGDTLDITGGVITAYYDYEIVEDEQLNRNMISGFDNTTVGEQPLTVTFEDKALTYIVTVSHVSGDATHENEVAPTCVDAGGYDEVVYCSYCGEELSREHVDVPALGHDLVHHDTKAATCTEIGWEAYDACSRCDYSTYVEIPALGHDLHHHDAKEATCTEVGWEEYDACSRCDYSTYTELPALGHIPGEPVCENEVPPSYTTEGSYDEVVYCARCGVEIERHTYKIDRLPFECTLEWNAEDVAFIDGKPCVAADGTAKTPRFTVKDSDGYVVNPRYYDYVYTNNVEIGTALITVTMKDGFSGVLYGTFEICSPTEIKTQPKAQTVANGKTAKFTVAALGKGVKYQWYYSTNNGAKWTKWSGKTSASVSVAASAKTNGNLYRCEITKGDYRSTSKSAKLTVSGVKPRITAQPKKTTVAVGETATFKVVAAGTGLKYQWYYSKDNGAKWVKWCGKTKASVNVTASAANNGTMYRCVVKNTKGSVTSSAVKMTVSGVKPRILTQPKAVTVKSGKTVKFTVAAAGVGLKYQWQYSKNGGKTWTKLSGKTSATLSLKAAKKNNGWLYRCVVKNDIGSVNSKAVKLTVK